MTSRWNGESSGWSPQQGASTLAAMTDDVTPARYRAPRGTALTCANWLIEAPYRMIQNNLDPEVAEDPDRLIVYGGGG